MNEIQQGTRDAITSLAHWAEESRMVDRETFILRVAEDAMAPRVRVGLRRAGSRV